MSIAIALSHLNPTPLHEFLEFPPIIQSYEFLSDEDKVGEQTKFVTPPLVVHIHVVVDDEGIPKESDDIKEFKHYLYKIKKMFIVNLAGRRT
ncbi:hypothetical protein V6N13_072435 [Hibiscus sabdariffa]|uniref:Uncharacterized protein n=1 Tax=Hibiscus sabdariffa TaxID=183260 RepID=A0ABR2R867_9ROSI